MEFDEFVTLAAKFIVEEDAEALEKELREAFRLYDKEGKNESDNNDLAPEFSLKFRNRGVSKCIDVKDY